VRACLHACVYACVRVRVHACVCACVCVLERGPWLWAAALVVQGECVVVKAAAQRSSSSVATHLMAVLLWLPPHHAGPTNRAPSQRSAQGSELHGAAGWGDGSL